MTNLANLHVAVVGGGCAGLAAAAALAERGITVTLYEASPNLGGRARGVTWKKQALDNGQHILLGAYRETLRLLQLAGVREEDALLRLPLQLSMHKAFELKACTLLPAPLHILSGLLMTSGLSWSERMSAVSFMLWMRLQSFRLPHDEPLATLLARKRQPQRLINVLWEPLCLAALNTPLADASARIFLNVLRDSFAGKKAHSDMLLPRSDLSTLIAEPLAAYVIDNKGTIHRNLGVTRVSKQKQGFVLTTVDGTTTSFSHVIVAVSPFRLSDITGDLSVKISACVNLAEQLRYQPIYTVYLQYPPTVKLKLPMLGFAANELGRISQWVFDRGALYGQHGLLAVVISAEGAHQKLTQDALALKVIEELNTAFSDEFERETGKGYGSFPQPLWHKVIAEKRATFSCDVDLQRPPQLTAIDNLYLAGDYTAGDYPATIEGAVRSGVQCATYILDSQKQKD